MFGWGLAASHEEAALSPTIKMFSNDAVLLLASSVPELYLDFHALDIQSPLDIVNSKRSLKPLYESSRLEFMQDGGLAYSKAPTTIILISMTADILLQR